MAYIICLKSFLIIIVMFHMVISVWILVAKSQFDVKSDKSNEDNINPIIPPLYGLLSIVSAMIFGLFGIYYSSETILAIYAILTVLLVPISVLVMLQIKVYIQIVFNCVISGLTLILLHQIKTNKLSNNNDRVSERS